MALGCSICSSETRNHMSGIPSGTGRTWFHLLLLSEVGGILNKTPKWQEGASIDVRGERKFSTRYPAQHSKDKHQFTSSFLRFCMPLSSVPAGAGIPSLNPQHDVTCETMCPKVSSRKENLACFFRRRCRLDKVRSRASTHHIHVDDDFDVLDLMCPLKAACMETPRSRVPLA